MHTVKYNKVNIALLKIYFYVSTWKVAKMLLNFTFEIAKL